MDDFEAGTELYRVYLAGSLGEAQKVETALDAADIEYTVEVETFSTRGFLAGFTSRKGAGFYVLQEDLRESIDALSHAGLVKGLVQDPSPA
jgi:hypothetical protein